MPDDAKHNAADEAFIRKMQREVMNLPAGPKKESLRKETEKAKKAAKAKRKGFFR